MNLRSAFLAVLAFIPLQAPAVSVPLDLTAVRAGPITVVRTADSLSVAWPDETARVWRATFSLNPAQPLITSIAADGEAVVRSARPFYQGETGKRRGGWNAFFDDPTTHPDGTRHVQSTFRLRAAHARSVGERVEIVFDGLRMGSFDGGLAYTFYPGSRLIQQEAVLTTYDADVAYYYDAGLEMAADADRQAGNNMRTEAVFYDTDGALRRLTLDGLQAERVPVQARYRTLALKTAGGSVAVFPAPHAYFFPRDFTSNLGFVWHRAWRGRVALGIRQLRDENWQYYPWVNAPPGRPQRMSVFFLLSPGAPDAALAHVLRYTNSDRFRPLDGYKTLSTHWHLADTVQALAHGFGWTPPFKPVLKVMGVDASMIMDFHGDGHPNDLTDLRLDELHAYFGALRAQSDPDFLLIPAEEANVHLGGHWALVFPKPVYWFMNRPKAGAFVSTHPKYGTVYSVADANEMLDLVRREGGYMYQTHPRTKGSTGFPDRILTTDYFRDGSYLGVGCSKVSPPERRRREPNVARSRPQARTEGARSAAGANRRCPGAPQARTEGAPERRRREQKVPRSAAGANRRCPGAPQAQNAPRARHRRCPGAPQARTEGAPERRRREQKVPRSAAGANRRCPGAPPARTEGAPERRRREQKVARGKCEA